MPRGATPERMREVTRARAEQQRALAAIGKAFALRWRERRTPYFAALEAAGVYRDPAHPAWREIFPER